MEIWLIAGATAAVAALVLAWGSARIALQGAGADSAGRLAIYKDQLSSLADDVSRGSLTTGEADALRTEIARRMLAVERETQTVTGSSSRPFIWGASFVVPIIALLLYASLGAPNLPGLPQAERLANAEKNSDIDAMIYKVERHLAEHPDDAQGWQLLLSSYRSLGRFGDEAKAYRQLMALQPPTAERYTGLAEALLFQGQGVMPEEGVKAIQQALALDPKDSKARYYEALALAQDGKSEAALAKFNALLAEAPADAPYREAVQRQIDLVNAGKAARPNGPTADQVAAAGNMSAGDQQQMIRGMVDGLTQKLAANPKDLSGWLRLIRARSVLGDLDLAKTALATARTTFTSDAGAIEQINALAKELNLP